MSLTFYYSPMSTATITDIVIEELGIPCNRVKIDIKAGGTKTPEYLRLNPNGKVPMIVHDDIPIWESSAITMYLGETFGVDKKLYPNAGPRRGEAMKWIAWSGVTLGEATWRYARNTMDWIPAEQHNVHAATAAKADLKESLSILNQALTGKQFLTGDYSLVDTHLNSFIDWLRMLKIDFSTFPTINAWSERCCARPAYKKVMSRE